jgi:hypothetical protein
VKYLVEGKANGRGRLEGRRGRRYTSGNSPVCNPLVRWERAGGPALRSARSPVGEVSHDGSRRERGSSLYGPFQGQDGPFSEGRPHVRKQVALFRDRCYRRVDGRAPLGRALAAIPRCIDSELQRLRDDRPMWRAIRAPRVMPARNRIA